jgi:hypothetical protein
MFNNQESLTEACVTIDRAVADLRGALELGIPLWDDEMLDICNKLETASLQIRAFGADSR